MKELCRKIAETSAGWGPHLTGGALVVSVSLSILVTTFLSILWFYLSCPSRFTR